MNATETKRAIQSALADFQSYSLPDAARRFFAALGYQSDRHIPIHTPADFVAQVDQQGRLTTRERETLSELSALHLLFQITDAELAQHTDLFQDPTAADATLIHSYLFFAAELPASHYTRTKLAALTRAINKPLPMPALVLFRHGNSLSLSIIHRRLNRREADKDVLEKTTLIKDIACAAPIRAHIEILNDFALANLDADFGIHNFVSLHNAWQKRLASYPLNDKFYAEVATWYFWAKKLIVRREIVPQRVDTDPERFDSTIQRWPGGQWAMP